MLHHRLHKLFASTVANLVTVCQEVLPIEVRHFLIAIIRQRSDLPMTEKIAKNLVKSVATGQV